MEGKTRSRDLLLAISNTLKSEYGFTVHIEKLPEDFGPPCFYVELMSTAQRKIGFKRYERKQDFCIYYYPKEANQITVNEVGENLLFLLECIKVGKNHKSGSGMRFTIIDQVLHFYMSYHDHLMLKEEQSLMEDLAQRSRIKNDR